MELLAKHHHLAESVLFDVGQRSSLVKCAERIRRRLIFKIEVGSLMASFESQRHNLKQHTPHPQPSLSRPPHVVIIPRTDSNNVKGIMTVSGCWRLIVDWADTT
jgi:hypothetical protein